MFSLGFLPRIKPVCFIVLLQFIFSNPSFCQQNLVYNGDFEEYSSCPIGESGPFQNPKEIEKCLGWRAPTYGTSDYFNVCANGNNVGVPTNISGYQFANSGNGYCGFIASAFDTISNFQWWEYIQGKVQPLLGGKIYMLSIYLNSAEDSYYWVDKIGVHLSENVISNYSTAEPLINIHPQFQTPSGVHIYDTLNWVRFEWKFVATGKEKYITIGNFNDFFHSNAILSPQGGTKGNSYVFIDDVSIIELSDELNFSNVFTPNNDGINDSWTLPEINWGDEKVVILNRWGEVIYSSSTTNFSWDGKTNNGKESNEGAYFYVIELNEKEKLTGFIQLVR